jgi:hypothetical protein
MGPSISIKKPFVTPCSPHVSRKGLLEMGTYESSEMIRQAGMLNNGNVEFKPEILPS